jgi:hypothetical protein
LEELQVSLSKILTPELEKLPDLGSGEEGKDDFAVQMAKAPICHSLSDIFAAFGKPLPPDLRLYDRFKLWLVPHRLGVLRRKGMAEPVSVGIEVEYKSADETCSVVSLLPSPEFVRYGSLSATVKLTGSVEASGACTPGGDEGTDSVVAPTKAFGGLSFSAKSGGTISLSFSADVITPYISAVGLGSGRAEWRFNKNKEALFGRDVETWSLLALPKRRKELSYRMRFNLTSRTIFFPTRRESDWVDIECTLG